MSLSRWGRRKVEISSFFLHFLSSRNDKQATSLTVGSWLLACVHSYEESEIHWTQALIIDCDAMRGLNISFQLGGISINRVDAPETSKSFPGTFQIFYKLIGLWIEMWSKQMTILCLYYATRLESHTPSSPLGVNSWKINRRILDFISQVAISRLILFDFTI